MYQTQGDQSVDITNNLQVGQPWRDSTGNAELTRRNSYDLDVSFFESGIALRISMYRTHLNFRAFVPDTYRDRTQGFLGNLDSNPNNEFHTRENTNPIPNLVTDQQIFPHLDNHCELLIELLLQTVIVSVSM